MNYITNQNAIILIFSNGERHRVEKLDNNYPKILNVFSLPKEDWENEIKLILNPVVERIKGEEGFEVIGDTVFYKGEELPQTFVDKVMSIIRDGLPVSHFEKFWERLSKNPSQSSVNELIDFLSYKELPITEDGYFIAYRGVGEDYFSIHGNPSTKVLQGKVDDSGRIWNGVGETIEVRRRDVDDNRGNGCSQGLHVGSLDYAKSWGPRVIIVKVDPADVVSVPNDCSCQKCRVSKYVILKDLTQEIESSVVDEDGESTLVSDQTKEWIDTKNRIENYLDKKINEGANCVTIRQIQNIFSPNWLSKEKVYAALQELFYDWEFDEDIGTDVVWLDGY